MQYSLPKLREDDDGFIYFDKEVCCSNNSHLTAHCNVSLHTCLNVVNPNINILNTAVNVPFCNLMQFSNLRTLLNML